MIEKGRTYIVMGLLDPDSTAFVIGQTLAEFGGNVIYTMQNERLKSIFFDRSELLSERQKAALDIRFCDVTDEDQVRALFEGVDDVAGVVHSIAYSNPKTCLGEEFHTEATDDITFGFHVSAVSLATVTRCVQPYMPNGGSIVTLTFDSRNAYPFYNWMGVNKAALEAVVRGLARRHGRDLLRVNAVSAGPLSTKAAKAIPGFGHLSQTWAALSPLPWSNRDDKKAVANAVAFLLGPYSAKTTGQTLYVDGGVSIVGGSLQPHERRPS